MARYSIGDASAALGVSQWALRRWERTIGIPSPRRTAGGHRVYDEEDLALVHRLVQLTRHGHSLAAARRILVEADGAAPSPETRTLQAMSRITRAVARGGPLRPILGAVCLALQDALVVDRVIVYLVGHDGRTLRRIYRAERSRRPSVSQLEVAVGSEGGLARALRAGRPEWIHARLTGPEGRQKMRETGVVSGLAIPVVVAGRSSGLLFVDSPGRDRRFSAEERLIAGILGDCIGIALDLQRLRQPG